MKSSARPLARASLAAAAGVTALYLGSVVPGVRFTLLFIAALGAAFIRMSCAGSWAWGCYAVTAALSLLLLPDKTLAIIYALLPGYYPILKLRVERVRSVSLRYGAKLAIFHAAFALVWLSARLYSPLNALLHARAVWILWAGALFVFLLYDYVLGQMILYYLRKIAGRLK